MAETRWLPLESNPDVMNKYIQKLGAPNDWQFIDVYDLTEAGLSAIPHPVVAVLLLQPLPSEYVHSLGVRDPWQFVDVWGLDPELLLMVPRPVAAVLLLYPITEKSEGTPLGSEKDKSDLYFIKQNIGNACGTIGLIHSLCNNAEKLGLDEKHLKKFFESTKDMTPADRGKFLEEDHAFGEAHDESAQEGQTQAPPRDEKVDLHFVAFIHRDGELFEMDGRKDNPVCHGNTTEDTLLEDTVEVVKKFMARDPDNLNFTVVALAKV